MSPLSGFPDYPRVAETFILLFFNSKHSCCFSYLTFPFSFVLLSTAAITTYIRYRQVEYYAGSVHMKRSNKVTLFMGLLSCLGISMVGNFQVSRMWTPTTTFDRFVK